MTEREKRTALIAGSTGLVGRHLLELLVASGAYQSVISVGRGPRASLGADHRHEQVDFDRFESWEGVDRVDDVYCCLGTTIKKAGSKRAFERVDHDYPLALARRGLQLGASQYLIVTAQGASTTAPFFYSRVKGNVERGLAELSYPGLYVFRPTLLVGERDERRPGEEFAERAFDLLSPVMRGPLERFKPVLARAVAASMVQVALDQPLGFKAFEAEHIRSIAAATEQASGTAEGD